MSTSAYVFVKINKNDDFKGIYVGHDGYPEHLLKVLQENYTTYEKAIKLISYGGASAVYETIEKCSFYCRDYNEDKSIFKLNKSQIISKEFNQEYSTYSYVYLFENNEWKQFKYEYLPQIEKMNIDLSIFDEDNLKPMGENESKMKSIGKVQDFLIKLEWEFESRNRSDDVFKIESMHYPKTRLFSVQVIFWGSFVYFSKINKRYFYKNKGWEKELITDISCYLEN